MVPAGLARIGDDAPALDDGARRLRYAELGAAVAADAAWLTAGGSERAALVAGNGCGWAIADQALAAAGIPVVPLPAVFTDAQMRHALDDAGIDTLLTDDRSLAGRLGIGFRAAADAPGSGLASWRRDRPGATAPLPGGTIKITYTSGSTGTPKGVCLDRHTLADVVGAVLAATAALQLRRHLAVLPLATLLENIAGLAATLAAGGQCLLPPASRTGLAGARLDPRALTACIADLAPDSLILVPELLKALVLAAENGWQPPASLRFIAVGGARVSAALLARAEALGLPAYEGYGLSECGSVLCLNTPAAHRRGSVGQPLPHVRLRVADDGELRVTAPRFAGYLGASAPQGEFATGDLGRIDADGYVYIEGRAKNLLITSLGRNVAPEWVEGELLRHAAIGQACVAGDDRPHLAALLVPRDATVSGEDLAAAVAATNAALPDYARVRRYHVLGEPFTTANGLLTGNGRLRRDRILARHAGDLEVLYATPACTATES